jgi:hypothetical protein
MDQPECLPLGQGAELMAHSPELHRFATEPDGCLDQRLDFGS